MTTKQATARRKTAMERLRELRKESDVFEAITTKKHDITVIRVKEKKKKFSKRYKAFRDSLNREGWPIFAALSDEQLQDLWKACDDVRDYVEDVEAYRAQVKKEKKEEKEREKELDKKLSKIKTSWENLGKIDKVIDKYSDESFKYKKYKKYGYDMIDGEFVVNEERLIKGIKKRSKEFKEYVDSFKYFLNETMGSNSPVMENVEKLKKSAMKNYKKASRDFIESFEVAARESTFFKMK